MWQMGASTLMAESVVILLEVAVVHLLVRGIRKSAKAAVRPNELTHESLAERYDLMLRLLDGSEEIFQSRKDRRKLFRKYLRQMSGEYARLISGLRERLVQSHTDRPDLAKTLFRLQLEFKLNVLGIEWRLLRHAIGMGTVDVRSVLLAVEKLRVQCEDMLFIRAVTFAA